MTPRLRLEVSPKTEEEEKKKKQYNQKKPHKYNVSGAHKITQTFPNHCILGPPKAILARTSIVAIRTTVLAAALKSGAEK